MSLLKNLKIIILVIGVLLILILIRMSDSHVFKGHVKSAVEVVRDHGNTITLNQLRKIPSPYLVIEIGSGSRHDSLQFQHSVQIPFESLLDKESRETLDHTKGEMILCSDDISTASKAWIILNQLGYKNVLILTSEENPEELKYKFQPDTTARLEQVSM